VLSTVRDAADRDYHVYVLTDASADPDPHVHDVLTDKVLPMQAHLITVAELDGLLADCCPAMSTQQTTGPSTPGERADAAKRIVVGIDGSPSSRRALEWAGRQAALTSATLHLLTTWHVPFSDPLSGIPDYPDFQ